MCVCMRSKSRKWSTIVRKTVEDQERVSQCVGHTKAEAKATEQKLIEWCVVMKKKVQASKTDWRECQDRQMTNPCEREENPNASIQNIDKVEWRVSLEEEIEKEEGKFLFASLHPK